MSKRLVIPEANIIQFDVEELACYLTGLDYDKIDADESLIDEMLIEVYGLGLDGFFLLMKRLLPLIDVGKSDLTKKTYAGFADKAKQMWFTKMEVGK